MLSGPLRIEALVKYYDNPIAKYFGFIRTLERI
jgi:hypothetical protein